MTGNANRIQLRNRTLGFVMILFVMSLLVRLPNLDRPVSKHYEFNTAVVLINIISWREGGGAGVFHYTPVLNFQNAGDKLPPNNLFIDKNGNSVYLSFGPGWYIIPYFIYQAFHLPAVALPLQIINLIFHLATILLFFYLLEKLIDNSAANKYSTIAAACCFIIFSPGPLWFLGNGYANVTIMLPFVLGFFILVLPMFTDPAFITLSRLIKLGVIVVVLVYIDWYILFLGFGTAMLSLYRWGGNRRYGRLVLTIVLSIAAGLTLLFIQFASYMGADAVLHYWMSRSSERSFDLAGSGFIKRLSFLPAYFISSFLPLLVLLTIVITRRFQKKIKPLWTETEKIFLSLFAFTTFLYNAVLFNWSTEHEYPILPWAIFLSYITARYLGLFVKKYSVRNLLLFFLAFSIAQYYWINRPGKIARDGLAYDSFKMLGDSLKKLPPDYSICISLEQNPMVEYYAGRNIIRAPDSLTVQNLLDELKIKKAVWITHNGYHLDKILVIR